MTNPIGFLGVRQDLAARQGADLVPSLPVALQNSDGTTRDVTAGTLVATISKNGVHVADMVVTKGNPTVEPQFTIDVPHATTLALASGPTPAAPESLYDWGARYTEGDAVEDVAWGQFTVSRNIIP